MKSKKTLALIWIGFFIIPMILFFFLLEQTEDSSQALKDHNLINYYLLSAANGVIGYFISKAMILKKDSKMHLPLEEKTKLYTAPFMLRMMFYESISILGFIAASTVKNYNEFFPFMIATMALMLLAYPSHRKIENIKL